MKHVINLILGILIVAGCKNVIESNGLTNNFEKGKPLSELKVKKLKEVSGLTASFANNGLLWAHNDSGNKAEVFLIDEALNVKCTYLLAGIQNRDWEDITVGPGRDAAKTYVYIGDIGDNDEIHPYKYIYRFEEPVLTAQNDNIVISTFDTIVFKLEDRIKDTESLMIDPDTKNLYVISKREDPVYIYEIKYSRTLRDTITATRLTSLPFNQIVAADYFSARGDILMKNYEHIYYWENTRREPLTTLLKNPPVEVPYEKEPQGETIAWRRDGDGFYTLSEKKKKQSSFLYLYTLKNNFQK